jgi:hypothetical protein
MHPETSSDSGKMNNSMQFRPIEVQLAFNWHVGYNLMAAIGGSPYFDSYLQSQKLPFLYLTFHYDLFFMHSWDWTLAKIRYCLVMICHELQALMICSGWELASYQLRCWAGSGIQILSLRALLMEIGLDHLY